MNDKNTKKIVYIDGVFDLFHRGHLESFKKAKNIFPNTFLIVGVMSDKEAESYKRQPLINEEDRYEIIRNLKMVDLVVEDCPLIVDEEFINKYNIDMIVHGFADKRDADKQKEFFEIANNLNKFQQIEYYSKISTTDIIKKILNIHRVN